MRMMSKKVSGAAQLIFIKIKELEDTMFGMAKEQQSRNLFKEKKVYEQIYRNLLL